MKHLLKLKDLTSDEIFGILNLADQLKYERKNNVKHPYLEGKKLGMIFQKSSTRTRDVYKRQKKWITIATTNNFGRTFLRKPSHIFRTIPIKSSS